MEMRGCRYVALLFANTKESADDAMQGNIICMAT
jgi:hypothetical protein